MNTSIWIIVYVYMDVVNMHMCIMVFHEKIQIK